MNARIALLAFALLILSAAARGELRIIPSTVYAGHEFVVQFDGNGCGPFSQARSEVAGEQVTIVYEDNGVCFATQPPGALFVSAVVRVLSAGTYTIRHRDEYRGTVLFTGSLGSVTVQPAPAAARPPYSLNGLWFVPTEPGIGVDIIEGDSGQLFVMWFTYLGSATASSAPASWFVASTVRWTSASQATGVFYTATGPRMGTAYDPALIRFTPVGTLTITAHSADSITFTAQGAMNSGLTPVDFSRTLSRFRF